MLRWAWRYSTVFGVRIESARRTIEEISENSVVGHETERHGRDNDDPERHDVVGGHPTVDRAEDRKVLNRGEDRNGHDEGEDDGEVLGHGCSVPGWGFVCGVSG